MSAAAFREPTGHVQRVERQRGDQWYSKYRLPDGRQVQKLLGPAWTERGRPPAGFFTKRTAEAALRSILEQARQGTLPGMVRTGVTVNDACDEFLRWIEHDRGRKTTTVADYRITLQAHIRPTFGEMRVEDITSTHVEHWLASMRAKRDYSNRTMQKAGVIFHGVMERARKRHKLLLNPVKGVDLPRPATRIDIDVLNPEEVMQLVNAAVSD